MKCVYCLGNKSQKITREHVISSAVLKTAFGAENKNVSRSDIFGNKVLIDHEHIIKDVCEYCNSIMLSPYDSAGAAFVKEINKNYDGEGLEIQISFENMVWLLKTHLNYIRLFPEKETKNYYTLAQDIYSGIGQKDKNIFGFFKMFVQGWQGKSYFWNEDDIRRIQFFSYKSIYFPHQKILVSNFTIKWLDTFILFPSNLDYSNFEQKVKLTTQAMKLNHGFDLQEINSENVIKNANLKILKIAKTEDIINCIKKITT